MLIRRYLCGEFVKPHFPRTPMKTRRRGAAAFRSMPSIAAKVMLERYARTAKLKKLRSDRA